MNLSIRSKDLLNEFKDKVVIVTGATSGVGRQASILFAKSGMQVVAAGRNQLAGNSLVKEIKESGGKILFVPTQIEIEESVQKLVEGTSNQFGGLDFALNCAGTEGRLAPITEQKESDWNSVININLKGVWFSMKNEIPAMLKCGSGAIVNISSQLTERGLIGASLYTASKAGVNALTRVAAVEYGKFIRVNAISPGAIETPMLERMASEEVREQLKIQNPLGKIANTQDIANAVLWLFSSQSGHINGQNITIDGGHSLLI